MKHRRLQELDRSDFEIVKGEPDIRGWDLKDTGGQKLGEVEELIVDAKEKKVRYMVVDLDDNKLKLHHRKVLVPIGLAELDGTHDDVLTPKIGPQQFAMLPEYDRNNLTADVERRICSTLERSEQPVSAPGSIQKPSEKSKPEKNESDEVDREFYEHENYNLDNLYKNRLHEAQPDEIPVADRPGERQEARHMAEGVRPERAGAIRRRLHKGAGQGIVDRRAEE